MFGRALVLIAAAFSAGVAVRVPTGAVVVAQAPTFSSGVDTVRLDVSVRQGGRAVRGLVADDFDIVDNGVRQTVTFVSLENTPINVVLALDMSGSVQGARLAQLQQAGQRVAGMLEPGDTAALVSFSDRATIAADLTADRQILMAALRRPTPGTDTALVDAAHAAMVLGSSTSTAAVGRPLVIVFSDGVDTASFLPPSLVLDAARRLGPVVYAVTSPMSEPDPFLEDLVRLTGGRRVGADSPDRLSDAFAEALTESRQRYLIGYSPTGVERGGWHELTVRVRGNRGDVRARPGYLGR
jgi:VWFA-related protein